MKSFAEKNNLLSPPRRMLISSFFEKNILSIVPLLRWYLKHGFKVTKLYEVV